MGEGEGEGEIYQRMQAHLAHHSCENLSSVDELSPYRCGICLTLGNGPRYRCGVCNMRIHRTCSSHLKGQQPCFLHPGNHYMSIQLVGQGFMKCHICDGHIAGCHYKCGDPAEDVHVHPICFQLRHAPGNIVRFPEGSLRHFSHGHALMEADIRKRYVCDGCGTPGMGLRLRCGHCDFNLHPYCFSCPREQPCFLGHTGHDCSLLLVQRPWRLQCHFCGGTIGRSDASLGMYYACNGSKAYAHPLCAQLLHDERRLTSSKTSGDTDGVAKLLRVARRVGGKIIQRKMELALISGTLGTGEYFSDEYQVSGDVGDAASSTMEHVADGISDKMFSVHEAFSTATGGVVDGGGDGFMGMVADFSDALCNFL